ncbi:replication-relaxation family protein [Kitasatospora arboriphila]|uniref:Protein involved in plasmid replication-relaxation n=1 Tax=Kitasatospora arboriphila TaxID=258052 RepID=A0ABN1THL7_9ACTN
MPARARSTDLARLASRLTGRDLWLLHLLLEHRVLTTGHITDLAFTGRRSANRRLADLRALGLTDSFRPHRRTGSHPAHHVLGRLGAQLLAARHATTPAALGWHPELATRTAYSPFLAHDLGATAFFTRLAHHSRTHPDSGRLTAWWSEQRCEHHWGDLVRPDAYGHWQTPTAAASFFLEYDTGTEPLTRLAAKLNDYAEAAATTRTRPLVLFTLHSTRREQTLHQRLDGHDALARIAAATTARDLPAACAADHHPAAAVWLPVGRPAHRTRLAGLPAAWPVPERPWTAPPDTTAPTAHSGPGSDRGHPYIPAPPPLPPGNADQIYDW